MGMGLVLRHIVFGDRLVRLSRVRLAKEQVPRWIKRLKAPNPKMDFRANSGFHRDEG